MIRRLSIVGVITTLQILAEGRQIVWENSAEVDSNSIETHKPDVNKMSNNALIFPGTKWCGAGNIAENEDDLGVYRDTDKCCRNHDLCPDIIEGHQTKYNLTNPNFFTRLSCDCDEDFYKCLKSVNDKPSMQIGNIYFTALNTKCFKKEYPIKACKQTSVFPTRRCLSYELDENHEKIYQWFDVKYF